MQKSQMKQQHAASKAQKKRQATATTTTNKTAKRRVAVKAKKIGKPAPAAARSQLQLQQPSMFPTSSNRLGLGFAPLSTSLAPTPTTRFAPRRFFSTTETAAAATDVDIDTAAAAADNVDDTADQIPTQTSGVVDPDAPQLYIGPDLYVVRPTNVREALRVVRAFCNDPVEQPISLAINLGLDPRKPNQSVRGMAPVPHGNGGKTVLAVFAQGDKALEAKEAGADIVGAEDLIKEILAGKIEFTRCVATPDMMKHLSKVARVLGPKGLMPNPKLGTVTADIKGAVANSKLGQIEFRNDKKGVVHAIVGKSSWSVDKLEENINAFVKAIADAKPSGAKGQYFKSSFIGNNSGWSQNLDIRLFPFKQ